MTLTSRVTSFKWSQETGKTSTNLLSDLFRSACRQLGPLALATQPDPEALAEQVFNAFCDNGYGIYDPLIASLTEALGPQGLQALKQRFEQLAQENPVKVERWAALGYTDPTAEDYQALVTARFDYWAFSGLELAIMIIVVVGYFVIVVRLSGKEYREVIAEKFGDRR